MTEEELIALVTSEVKDLSDELVTGDYSNAVDDAERETGFTLPQTDSLKIYWVKERTKRHLIWYLFFGGAKKFRVKQYYLDQKFQHYKDILEYMDKAFFDFQESRPDLFAGVDPSRMFGTVVSPGFSYDDVGKDTTYFDDNVVEHYPNSET